MAGGWEVLDTAVKIGLGAAITGFVTLWVNGRQLRAQASQEQRRQRKQDWDAILQTLIAFRKSLCRFQEEASDYAANRGEAQLEPGLEKRLEAARAKLETTFLDLLEAHTRLGILDPASAAVLQAYRDAADDWFREAWNGRDELDVGALAAGWEKLEAPQERLFQQLRTLEQHLNG